MYKNTQETKLTLKKRFLHRPVLLINKTTRFDPFHTEILDLSKNSTCQNCLNIFPEISISKYIRNNPYFKEKISSQTCVIRFRVKLCTRWRVSSCVSDREIDLSCLIVAKLVFISSVVCDVIDKSLSRIRLRSRTYFLGSTVSPPGLQ